MGHPPYPDKLSADVMLFFSFNFALNTASHSYNCSSGPRLSLRIINVLFFNIFNNSTHNLQNNLQACVKFCGF